MLQAMQKNNMAPSSYKRVIPQSLFWSTAQLVVPYRYVDRSKPNIPVVPHKAVAEVSKIGNL